MQYAVIKTGSKQYKIAEGDIIEVDKLAVNKDQEVLFDQVLLLVADGQVKVGRPVIAGVKIKGKVMDQFKGKKIRVAKFKAKSRYRRVMGFRPKLTRVQIEKIEAETKNLKPSKKTEKNNSKQKTTKKG